VTVIAYRDGTMAADTQTIHVDHVKLLHDKKIAKYKGHLFGLAGDLCPPLEEFKQWWWGTDRKKPMRGHLKFHALIITPSGDITLADQMGSVEKLDVPFFAIGSGKEFAIGAMAAGAGARKAVQIAIEYCPTVSGSVMSKRL
jgi:ATP-dependent protease HslVU (ClpYQ) peptidase subunit